MKKMDSLQRSPSLTPGTPTPSSASSTSKKPVFQFDRIGSLVRKNSVIKKREQEFLIELDTEKDRVVSSPLMKKSFDDLDPDEYQMNEGEERRFLDPRSQKEPLVQELIAILQEWINDELGDERIRMKINNLDEDLSDGLVYKNLLEKLSGSQFSMPTGELVQSEERRRLNVDHVIKEIEKILDLENQAEKDLEYQPPIKRWTAESILKGNLLSNIHLLMAIVDHYTRTGRIILELPKTPLKVTVVSVAKKNGQMIYDKTSENLISGFLMKKDGFDTLIDHSPEKLQFVKQSLLQFANFHLGKLGQSVEDLEKDFCNGVNFILLIGQLEGFFVPFYEYHPKPTTHEESLFNVKLVFDFLSDFGGFPSRNRPADLVRGDLKAILRILFGLFVKYKKQTKKSSSSSEGQDT